MDAVCARSWVAVIVVICWSFLSRPPLTYFSKASVSREVDTEGFVGPVVPRTPAPHGRQIRYKAQGRWIHESGRQNGHLDHHPRSGSRLSLGAPLRKWRRPDYEKGPLTWENGACRS